MLQPTHVLLDWPEILRRYYCLVSRCSASLISGAGPDALVRGHYITDLCNIISTLNPFQDFNKDISKVLKAEKKFTSKMRLEEFISYMYLLNGSSIDSSTQTDFPEVCEFEKQLREMKIPIGTC